MNLDEAISTRGALALVIGAVGVCTAIVGLSATLTACGGGGDADTETASPGATAFAVAPLFDDDGRPSAAAKAAEPADPGMRTRAGLYASAEQYRWELRTSAAYTVLVDLDTPEAAEAGAIDRARALRDPRPAAAPQAWFVQSADLSAGARMADTLGRMGLDPVFLIVGGAESAR